MDPMDHLFMQMSLFVCLHSPSTCQFSDIISRRFLDAFFPEEWSGPEFLISLWRAFRSRIWLMIILHFLEAFSIVYEKWGLRNWFSGGQPHSQQGSLLLSTFILNAFIITLFALFLCCFWIQVPKDFSLWYLTCFGAMRSGGKRRTGWPLC